MDYDLIVVKTLERVYKNYYYIIRGNEKKSEKTPALYYNMYKATGVKPFNDGTDIKDKLFVTDGLLQGAEGVKQ